MGSHPAFRCVRVSVGHSLRNRRVLVADKLPEIGWIVA